MAKEKKPMSGGLFRNKLKKTDKHPHMRGDATITCPHCLKDSDYWISAWTNTAGPNAKEPGERYQSLAFDPKESQHTPAPADSTKYDDDIPF